MARRSNKESDRPGRIELSDSAASALRDGRVELALRYYHELEWVEENPAWSLRAAECYRRLSRQTGEVSALMRAANRYEQRGFVREALALWTRVQAVDPHLSLAREALERLQPSRSLGLERLRSSLPPALQRCTDVGAEAPRRPASAIPDIPRAPRTPRLTPPLLIPVFDDDEIVADSPGVPAMSRGRPVLPCSASSLDCADPAPIIPTPIVAVGPEPEYETEVEILDADVVPCLEEIDGNW